MMKKIILIVSLCFCFNGFAFAFYPELNKEQIGEAVEYSKDLSNQIGVNSEWSVSSPRGSGWVELYTPFRAVAQVAREYSLTSKPLSDSEIKKAMLPYENKLIFRYYHYDIEQRFISSGIDSEYFAMIRTADNKIIYPFRYDTGTETVKKINLEFSFSAKDVNPNTTIYLLIQEPSGFEHEFEFNLSNIR